MSWLKWLRWPVVTGGGAGEAVPEDITGAVAATLPGLSASALPDGVISGAAAASLPGLAASASGTAGAPPDIGDPLSADKTMYSGHSLLEQPIPTYVTGIATERGYTSSHENQAIPGSTIKFRTAGDSANPYDTGTYNGYQNGGSVADILAELRGASSDYTNLILTERHDGPLVARYGDDTIYALRHYHDTFIAAAPGGQTYFYACWWWLKSGLAANPAAWIAHERSAVHFWRALASRINDALASESRSDRIAFIPACAALAELIEIATTGTLDGITLGSTTATVLSIILDEGSTYDGDNVHLTTLGSYYLACVVYSALYRRSPVGSTFRPGGVDATQAASLQQVAWTFIQSWFVTYGDLGGADMDLTERLEAAADHMEVWCDYNDAAGELASFQAFYAQTNGDNPVYQGTPTGGWWPMLP